jgi:hypothetical protein
MRRIVKRRSFWLGVMILAAIVFAIVFAVSTTSDSTEPAFRKVKAGMTGQEVKALIAHRISAMSPDPSESPAIIFEPLRRFWGSNARLRMEFDVGDQALIVKSAEIIMVPDNRTPWERIQDEYRYQKNRLGW